MHVFGSLCGCGFSSGSRARLLLSPLSSAFSPPLLSPRGFGGVLLAFRFTDPFLTSLQAGRPAFIFQLIVFFLQDARLIPFRESNSLGKFSTRPRTFLNVLITFTLNPLSPSHLEVCFLSSHCSSWISVTSLCLLKCLASSTDTMIHAVEVRGGLVFSCPLPGR